MPLATTPNNLFAECDSLDNLNKALQAQLKSLQISDYAFTAYGDEFNMGTQLAYQYVSANLQAWHAHFHESGYESLDTIGKRVRKSLLPVVWDLAAEIETVEGRKKNFYAEALAGGFARGISVPIHGPYQQFSILVLHLKANTSVTKNLLNALHLLALHYQQQLSTLLTLDTSRKNSDLFSKREIQCIKLAMRDMDAKAIAKELGLTKRTVDFHFSNINKKVGVANKFQALEHIKARKLID